MDFPLIPSGSLSIPFRGRGDRVRPFLQEDSPSSWPSPPIILTQKFIPAWHTIFIDVEYPEVSDHIDQSSDLPKWADTPPGKAITLYQKMAENQRRMNNTVDLYA